MIPFAYAKKVQLLLEFTIPYQKSHCGYAEYKYNNFTNFQNFEFMADMQVAVKIQSTKFYNS